MDGVIADYIFGEAKNYDKKRPLYDNIDKLKMVSEIYNIEYFILSVTKQISGIEEKNAWLDSYVPFFKKENRIIISEEGNSITKSSILKAMYLKEYSRDDSVIIVIDDDPRVLKAIREYNEDIILLKDTVLID